MKPYTMPLAERLELAAQACRAVHLLSCEQTCLEAKEQLARTKAELEERTRERDEAVALHIELIMAVARRWPGETRHQTALRYIRQVEESPRDERPAQEAKP